MTQTETRQTRLSIVTYLVLTFGFSSIFYRLIIRHSSHDLMAGLYVLGLMWCPGVSGLLTRLIFQGDLRGHGFGWGRTKYQLASYWIPLAYASVVYLPVWFAGYFDPHSPTLAALGARIPRLPHAALLPALFVVLATLGVAGSCISAVGEELGWRGFLVPQLAKVMPFPGVALTSGVIWALWHYPIVLFSSYRGAGPLWYSVVCFTVLVVGMSFLFAWMRLKSGSVWTGMLLHASHNLFIQSFFDPQTRHARITDLWTTEFGAGLALMGIVLAVIFYRKRGELPAQTA
ncbi:MAG TPA: CPBP family intramembrane glutamic endopeptidase [Terriglobia bacterium]|jgi:membrane protease YdiL (CAAX protease family)|nr:CPBP family intramembrane glutamic endopeptidase [Terriglobia bacterium]